MSHSTSILGSFGGQLLLGIAFLSSLASGVYLARTYRVVTSRYLAGFLATISLIPLADFVDHEIDPQHAPLILDIIDALTFPFAMAVGLVGGMLFWLAFVLTYTSGIRGREMRYFRVGAPVTVIVTFGALIPQHIQEAGLAQFGGWAEPIGSLGVLLAVGLIFGSIGYGAIQLFRTGRTHYASTLREMTLLTLSGIWLFFSLIVLPFLEIPDVEATGIGIFGTLGFIGIAVGHFDVLGETPATQVVGRDTAVENIESGIVVLRAQ